MRACNQVAVQSLLAFCALCSYIPAVAQYFPSSPMRIISPYPPGGGTDFLARTIGQRLTERFGHAVVVENRSGANGTLGAGIAAKAPPDGHTMLIVAAAYASGASLYRNLPYDPVRDLAPVSQLAAGPLVLVVHPSLPARSIRELVALARSRPAELNAGNSGTGSLPHLTAELFGAMSGVKFTHVPYKGPGLALIDVMSGQVSLYFMNILNAMPHAKSGKLRALGVSSAARSPIAPELPAIAEAGLQGFDMTNWYGLMVPGATPKDFVAKLQQETTRIMFAADVRSAMAASGMSVIAGTSQQFTVFLGSEMTKYASLIRSAGLKSE